MADVYTSIAQVGNFVLAAGYDRMVEVQLRSDPIFRQLVDKHPADSTNPGSTQVLNIAQEFTTLFTTPLTETSDVALSATPNTNQVTVTLNEYGTAESETLKLKTLAYTGVDPIMAYMLGKSMVDTHDKLVQTVLDAATHVIGKNSGTIKSDNNSFAEGSVTSTDILDDAIIRSSNALLKGRNAHGFGGGDNYLGIIHPDVAADIQANPSWLSPHQYVDTSAIYNGEIGTYMNVRFIVSPRCTVVADGTASAKVYRNYILGRQALAEVMAIEPHIVVGPQTDHLKRFFPMGWYSLGGWAVYRQEAIQIARTASTVGASGIHA